MRVFLWIMLFWPSMAFAGAWPRGEGNVFWAYSIRSDVGNGAYSSVYLEAGVSERLTYLFEIAQGNQRTAMTGLTWHFAESEATWQYAAGLAYGVLADEYSIRAHANLGRGWQYDDMSGWMTADVSAALGEEGSAAYKADFTLGRNLADGMSAFAQLFMFWDEELSGFHSVEAHVTQSLNDTFILDVGVQQAIEDGAPPGLVMSLWTNF